MNLPMNENVAASTKVSFMNKVITGCKVQSTTKLLVRPPANVLLKIQGKTIYPVEISLG